MTLAVRLPTPFLRAFYAFHPELTPSSCSSSLFQIQCRGGKRKSIKMMKLARQIKLGIDPRSLKAKKEAALKNLPPPSFAERIASLSKKKSSCAALQYPARVYEPVTLPEATDDVWSTEFFSRKIYSVSEALDMHREVMDPTMYNFPHAPVRLRLDLNMHLEKKKRFVGEVKQIADLPHKFVHGDKRTILVFVKDLELQKQALESGAELAGGPDLVKKIHKGQFRTDDFDFIGCHLDMMNDVTPLRGILKRKFPSRLNGGLAKDLNKLIQRYRYGIQYEIKSDTVIPEWGVCDTVVATLEMSNKQIEENIHTLIKVVCTHRPVTEILGHFIQRAVIMVDPSKEYFEIDFRKFAPPIPEPPEIEQTSQQSIAAQQS